MEITLGQFVGACDHATTPVRNAFRRRKFLLKNLGFLKTRPTTLSSANGYFVFAKSHNIIDKSTRRHHHHFTIKVLSCEGRTCFTIKKNAISIGKRELLLKFPIEMHISLPDYCQTISPMLSERIDKKNRMVDAINYWCSWSSWKVLWTMLCVCLLLLIRLFRSANTETLF